MVKYSIIIPTYNEKQNIPIMIYLIYKYLKNIDFEIVIVEDNSPDGTLKILNKLQSFYKDNKIKILERPGKLGLGTAYIDGIKLCSGEFVFIMDADMSHHPESLLDYISLQKEKNADIVTGSRYNKNGGVYGWNTIRKLISRGANFISNFFLNPTVSDMTGSFRLYKKSVLETLIKDIKSGGYAFQMEIIIKAQYMNLRIEEVGINFVDRLYGVSKLGIKDIVEYFYNVIRLYIEL